MRIVSLLPSATEIIDLLGAADQLVGRSHECDFPAGLRHLPVLTAQRTSAQTPAAIDAEVRSSLESGQSLYTLDTDALADLRPDVIVTQDLCDVCSIDLNTVRAAADTIADRTGYRPEIVSLDPETVEDVFDDMLAVGKAIGRERAAIDAIVELRDRFHSVQDHVNQYEQGVVVGFMEWTDPIFIAGHWTVQMIERAGGRHPLNEAVPKPGSGAAAGPQQAERIAGKSIRVPNEAFAATRPEVLVISPCGFDLAQTRAAVKELRGQDWFESLPAVQSGRVALVDGNQHFNRPGPRLAEAFAFLVGFIQQRPEVIPADFPWEPLPIG
ncbi:MAG: ABC transporter substrate-binding protein [Planctomycetota bacterium]